MKSNCKRRYCVIGTPVAHSRSPELFARIFEERGLTGECSYVINEIKTPDELKEFVGDMRSGKWDGCNVTMPWKTAVMPFMDECSDISKLTSAVNTIKRRSDGSLYGTSTDGAGLLWAINRVCLQAGIKASLQNVVILGAGGAARSVIAAFLNETDACCHIVCRDGQNKSFAEEIARKAVISANQRYDFTDFGDEQAVRSLISGADTVINCTPLGMVPMEGEIPVPEETFFKAGAVVVDAVYNPENTLFLQLAREQKCICVPGRMMLEGQAIVAADVLLSDAGK